MAEGTSTIIARAADRNGGGVEIKLADCEAGWLDSEGNKDQIEGTVRQAFTLQFEAEPDAVRVVEMPFLDYTDTERDGG